MLIFKVIQINLSRNDAKVTGKLKRIKVLVVGNPEHTGGIKSKIHSRPDWNYEVAGTVGIEHTNKEDLGEIAQLKELIKAYQIDQVFFALSSISYKDMLRQISLLQNERVVFKLIPDSMDFILGKSNVEYLESIPLVEVGISFSKGINQILKRMMDLIVAIPCFIILGFLIGPALLFTRAEKVMIQNLKFFNNPFENTWKNRTLLFWYIIKGHMSLVGGTIISSGTNSQLKPGLTGSVQMNALRIQTSEDRENYELYYLQNYSIWMDVDILLKSLFSNSSFSDELESVVNKKI